MSLYKTELTYLESTGYQAIDTGIVGKSGLEVEYGFNFTTLTQPQILFGEQGSSTNFILGMFMAGSGELVNRYGDSYLGSFTPSANTDYVLKAHFYSGEQWIDINGVRNATESIADSFSSSSNLYLFLANSIIPLYSYAKIYYCKIWDNGTLVRDFIPVLDNNNKPAMFDRVTSQLFYNIESGDDFSYEEPAPVVTNKGNKKLLRKKLDMFLATLRKKRPYYCEVEYLENTGTAYINTGMLSTVDSKVDITFGFTNMSSGAANNCAVFGGRSSLAYTGNTFTFFKLASVNPQSFRFDYNGQRTVGSASTLTWDTASKYRFQYTGSAAVTTNIVTGEEDRQNLVPASSYTTDSIHLFCVNTMGAKGQNMLGRIYHYWYTDGNKTINLIPVLDWNMRPAMYDTIGGQFFYNANPNATEFTYGREIHYVEYLETTSQASTSTTKPWINTLVSYWADFEIGVKLRENAANVCLSCGGGSYRLERINATNPYWRFQGGGSGYNYDSTIPITEYHVLKWKDGKISCDGEVLVEKNHLLNSGTYTALFTNSTASANTIYPNIVYFLKMWNPTDGTLVRDYLPAIDQNGVGFMFDKVTHTIFDNAGTGAFKYPARAVEYLESTGTQYINTGINPTDDYGYRIKNTYTVGQGEQCAIGCMDAGNRFVGIYTGGNANQISGAWGDYVGFLPSYTWTTGTILDVKCNYKNSRKMIIDNTEMKDISDVHITGTISNSIYIGARHYGSNVTKMQGKIYSVEITNNQDTVADFTPCFKDGQAGMLDKQNSVFYGNAGTGNFATGKVVEPEYES